MYLELIRLLNLVQTLDCWVTIYPSMRGEALQFVVQVSDADDFTRCTAKSDQLDRACAAAITILQDHIQRGGLD